jgi:hypothetical protein
LALHSSQIGSPFSKIVVAKDQSEFAVLTAAWLPKTAKNTYKPARTKTKQDARKLKMVILPELHRGPRLEFRPSVTIDVLIIRAKGGSQIVA